MTSATNNIRIVVFDNPDFGPSRRMVDTVCELADEDGDIDVEQVNVWQHPDKGVDHNVMTVPTTIIFVDEVEQKRICGLRSSRYLRRAIARITDRTQTRNLRIRSASVA